MRRDEMGSLAHSLNLLDPEHPSPARVGGEEAADDRPTDTRQSHNQANY